VQPLMPIPAMETPPKNPFICAKYGYAEDVPRSPDGRVKLLPCIAHAIE
jgi:hypothetical protein